MSTEAEGWSRDYGPGPSLSCPRACYGRSVGTRSQTGLGLRRETWVSSSGSRSCGRQGWGATKAAAGGTQRGVSPHCCPSQTPCPSTQRMPPCRRLKTQCPEERSLEMPASSRQVQAGNPLPSCPDPERAGPPWSLGAGLRPCPSRGSRPSPVGTSRAARPLGTRQGAWQGLVPWARPSEEGGRGPGLRSPSRKVGS